MCGGEDVSNQSCVLFVDTSAQSRPAAPRLNAIGDHLITPRVSPIDVRLACFPVVVEASAADVHVPASANRPVAANEACVELSWASWVSVALQPGTSAREPLPSSTPTGQGTDSTSSLRAHAVLVERDSAAGKGRERFSQITSLADPGITQSQHHRVGSAVRTHLFLCVCEKASASA